MIRTAVVGASGYTGAELVGLLARHPGFALQGLFGADSAGRSWEDLYPGRRHLYAGEIRGLDATALAAFETVFLALPHGVAAGVVRELDGVVERVIDLSGDLRLASAEEYRQWYGREHPAPELLGRAAYGLPELFAGELSDAALIACAGCYASVSQLAAAPALALADDFEDQVTISATSGTSGAGRKAELALSFSEVFGDLRPYRVGRHQHTPEIAAGLARHAGRPVRVTFVPHLAPIERGITVAVVLRPREPVPQQRVLEVYRRAYEHCPFVKVLDPADRLPAVRSVAGTNFCELAPVVDEAGGTLVVLGAIDNLLKGAAGQAVQVANLAAGLPETLGLLPETGAGAC